VLLQQARACRLPEVARAVSLHRGLAAQEPHLANRASKAASAQLVQQGLEQEQGLGQAPEPFPLLVGLQDLRRALHPER
jgi:hypothetical protein